MTTSDITTDGAVGLIHREHATSRSTRITRGSNRYPVIEPSAIRLLVSNNPDVLGAQRGIWMTPGNADLRAIRIGNTIGFRWCPGPVRQLDETGSNH